MTRLRSFRTYVVCHETQYIKSSAQINAYDAESVSELLNCHDQELTLGYLLEIRKQNGLEEAEAPEPEPKERTMTGGLAPIKMFQENDSKEQRAEQYKELRMSLLASLL
jgi:hypothetical protein